eukprot:gene25755-biopygen16521
MGVWLWFTDVWLWFMCVWLWFMGFGCGSWVLAVVHGCRRSGSCPSGSLPERYPRDEECLLPLPGAPPPPPAPRAPGPAPSALPGPRAPRGLTSAHFGRRSSAHLNAHMVRSI